MSKRVIQLDIFQAGFRDDNDAPVIDGSVEFYTADQTYTTPKNAYTTKLKDATITSVTLDANGAYPNGLFFDGATVYDLRLKDSVGAIIRNYNNTKIPSSTQNVKTVTAATYTATIDDDVILVDTTSNAITINLYPVEDSVNSIVIKNIGSASNSVTVDGYNSDLINGNSSVTLVDGAAQEYYSDLTQWFGAATTTGTTYTTTNLIEGSGINFTAGGGQTSVAIDVTDASIAASDTARGVIEIATDAESIAGIATTLSTTPANIVAILANKRYTSTAQTITTSGQVVLPHGLGVEPLGFTVVLQNTVAEFGYSVGDRAFLDMYFDTLSIVMDATNITIRYNDNAGVFSIINKTTGASATATNTSWEMYIKAWS